MYSLYLIVKGVNCDVILLSVVWPDANSEGSNPNNCQNDTLFLIAVLIVSSGAEGRKEPAAVRLHRPLTAAVLPAGAEPGCSR